MARGGRREGSGRPRVIPHVGGHCYCVECRKKRRAEKSRDYAGVGVDGDTQRVGKVRENIVAVFARGVKSLRDTAAGLEPARQQTNKAMVVPRTEGMPDGLTLSEKTAWLRKNK